MSQTALLVHVFRTSDEACKQCAPSDMDDKVSGAGTESEEEQTAATGLVLWGSDYLESITSVNGQISDYDIICDELITRMQHDYNNRATGRVTVSTHTIGTLAVSKESSPVGSALLIRKIEMQTEHKEQLLFALHCAPIVMARSARHFNDDDTDAFILHADESSALFSASPSLEKRGPVQGVARYLICVLMMCLYASLEKRGPVQGVVAYLICVFMMLFARA